MCIGKTGNAQSSNYSIQANIIYQIRKYINWPADKKTGDFVIGIIGDSPLFEELKKATANKTAGGQKIVIKQFSSSQSSFDCQILFIAEDESNSLKQINAETQAMPILIITERDGLAKKGSCINFIIEDERIKLEINENNIAKRNRKAASELLGLGNII